MMTRVEIYTFKRFPYCIDAKKIFDDNGIKYDEYLAENIKCKNEMIKRSKRYTVPQIFMNNIHIGGFNDLKEFIDKHDGLNKLKKP